MNKQIVATLALMMAQVMYIPSGACATQSAVRPNGDDPDPATLAEKFVTPPDSCRPWVYAFLLNGNLTRGGITADLEAMKRAGTGGMTVMEVDQGPPKGPVDFMSDEWRALFQHLVAEANRLGLEVKTFVSTHVDTRGQRARDRPWCRRAQGDEMAAVDSGWKTKPDRTPYLLDMAGLEEGGSAAGVRIAWPCSNRSSQDFANQRPYAKTYRLCL
jgi:hypothetical protein